MDGLVILLIIIGIVSKLYKGKDKGAAKGRPAQKRPGAERVPHDRKAWEAYLKEDAAPEVAEAVTRPAAAVRDVPVAPVQAAKKRRRAAEAEAVQTAAAKPARPSAAVPRAPQPVQGSLAMENGRHEGESDAEHAQHLMRAAQAEAIRSADQEAQQILREVNLRNLRTAVVMKEILDRPVSLRPRGRR